MGKNKEEKMTQVRAYCAALEQQDGREKTVTQGFVENTRKKSSTTIKCVVCVCVVCWLYRKNRLQCVVLYVLLCLCAKKQKVDSTRTSPVVTHPSTTRA
jgi:hypothetical protein